VARPNIIRGLIVGVGDALQAAVDALDAEMTSGR